MNLYYTILVLTALMAYAQSIDNNKSRNLRKAFSKKEKSEKKEKSKKKSMPKKKEKGNKSEKKEKAVKEEEEAEMDLGPNPCALKNPMVPGVECIRDGITLAGEQSGVNVTKGYIGDHATTIDAISEPFSKAGLCPVNVHWHLGTEHYSVGEYDENGSGPMALNETIGGVEIRQGYQCRFYNETDPKFTIPYRWKHCKDMVVGQTYEVHWPHSIAGACGTPWQYQTPFLDGVFCRDGVISFATDAKASQVGVQAQIFTIVNDESYYYGHLFKGMIVDKVKGVDVAYYTGSTTGSSFNNETCSPYTPISWHVDRKCHMISASSFDKMCQDMKAQADDMDADLEAHGSRELVTDQFAANNQHLLMM